MTPEQETKERIMQAAFELFSSRGYDKVSMNDIVKRSGLSKGGIFHHFGSKYALGRDTLMWWAEKHMGPILGGGELDSMEPGDVMVHFIDVMTDLTIKENSLTRFFWSVFDEALRRKEDDTVWLDFLNEYVGIVEKIYTRMGVKDPRMKAILFLSNMDGLALYYSMVKNSGMEIDHGALKAELVRTYVTFDEEV